jgi:hypothetical protein
MRMFALATAAAAALMFSAPAYTTPAFAQADVKVKVKSNEGGMTRKKVVIKQRGDVTRKKVVIRHGDRGRHLGWRNRDAGMKKVIIKKRGGEGRSTTVIKKKTFD